MGGMHTCPKCHVSQPEDQFKSRSKVTGQPVGWCRSCVAAQAKKWGDMHPEARAAAAARWRKRNLPKVIADQRVYREKNKGLVTRVLTEKKCSVCLEVKPADAFPASRYTRSGLDSRCKACGTAKSYAWNQANPGRFRANQRRSRLKIEYGLTPEGVEVLLAEQGGGCAICHTALVPQSPQSQTQLHIDHDHLTGKVRGLLCSRCNRTIGAFNDDPDLLQCAVDYLRKS